jgi:membrane-associated phospholipid phosphatase
MPLLSITGIDIELLRLIHHHRPEFLDKVLYYISYSTTFISISIILAIFLVSLVRKSKELKKVSVKMLVVLILAASVSFTLKNIFSRERPFHTYPDIEKLSQAGSSSFPSGHTLEVFAIATALAILLRDRRIFIPAFIWAFLVAYTRMALGVHYPSDITAGIIIGMLIGYFVPFLFKKALKRELIK